MSGKEKNTAEAEELVLAQEVMPEAGEEAEKEADSVGQEGGELAEAGAAEGDNEPASEGKQVEAHSPEQSEMPFALVHGQAFTNLPKDLYIPPDALEVILESFAGPLDLLLYLIRKQNIDILEIDVSEITHQYVAYVEMMEAMHFELAAEYLVMAAMLAEIKSRMLLPRSSNDDEEEEEDPRAQLIRRLQEYERFKQAAEDIDSLPRLHRDTQIGKAQGPDRTLTRPDPEVDMRELMLALAEVLRRADMFTSHTVEKEKLSTRERMTQVLDQLRGRQFVPFVSLFTVSEGRLGVVVTFLAVMELIKESLVEMVQTEAFGPIHVKARGDSAPTDGSEEDLLDDDSIADDSLEADTEKSVDAEGGRNGDPEIAEAEDNPIVRYREEQSFEEQETTVEPPITGFDTGGAHKKTDENALYSEEELAELRELEELERLETLEQGGENHLAADDKLASDDPTDNGTVPGSDKITREESSSLGENQRASWADSFEDDLEAKPEESVEDSLSGKPESEVLVDGGGEESETANHEGSQGFNPWNNR